MAKTRTAKSDLPLSKRILKVVDWTVIVVLAIVGVYIAIQYFNPNKPEPTAKILPDKGAIKIELFGGCGRGSEVQQIGAKLREIGIDVVDLKQETGFLYPSSIIVDRVGNVQVAESLAGLFGLPRDRIVLQKYDLMVDATVVIGLDYPEILTKLKEKETI